jgi:hypothetical protein
MSVNKKNEKIIKIKIFHCILTGFIIGPDASWQHAGHIRWRGQQQLFQVPYHTVRQLFCISFLGSALVLGASVPDP